MPDQGAPLTLRTALSTWTAHPTRVTGGYRTELGRMGIRADHDVRSPEERVKAPDRLPLRNLPGSSARRAQAGACGRIHACRQAPGGGSGGGRTEHVRLVPRQGEVRHRLAAAGEYHRRTDRDPPGACPIPRGRGLRSASAKAPVRPVTSAGRRDPAWLITPRPSAETTTWDATRWCARRSVFSLW
ncbi:hypothetical protein GCM10010381_08830 [Streptomyces xantholiticus]|nr:hypothetical protein GCM10010381_08830 [Streptomyces xantholiticus]